MADSIRISARLQDPDPAEAGLTPEQLAAHRQQKQDQAAADTAKQINDNYDAARQRPGSGRDWSCK